MKLISPMGSLSLPLSQQPSLWPVPPDPPPLPMLKVPLPRSQVKLPLPGAAAAEVPIVEVVETSAEAVVVEIVDPTTEIIVIIIRIETSNNNKIKTKPKQVKNLTRGVPKQVRMSQLMPVLAIGRKVAKLHTVVTPWSAAGPTS